MDAAPIIGIADQNPGVSVMPTIDVNLVRRVVRIRTQGNCGRFPNEYEDQGQADETAEV